MLRNECGRPGVRQYDLVDIDVSDARAILEHIDALTAERDKAVQHAIEQHQAADRIAEIAANMQRERDAALAKVPKIVACTCRKA